MTDEDSQLRKQSVTETRVRQYGEDGELVSETVTTVQVNKPAAGVDAHTGQYL